MIMTTIVTNMDIIFFFSAAVMKDVIVRRLALSHLMMGLSDGFQTVLIEHYMLGMMKRLAAIRLVAITDAAEREWNSVVDVCFKDQFI